MFFARQFQGRRRVDAALLEYDVIRQKHRIVIRYAVITTVTVITGTVTRNPTKSCLEPQPVTISYLRTTACTVRAGGEPVVRVTAVHAQSPVVSIRPLLQAMACSRRSLST